jgi:hypothetical protein
MKYTAQVISTNGEQITCTVIAQSLREAISMISEGGTRTITDGPHLIN